MPGELVLQALRHVWQTSRTVERSRGRDRRVALAAWKHVRATKDIDLLLGIGAEKHRVSYCSNLGRAACGPNAAHLPIGLRHFGVGAIAIRTARSPHGPASRSPLGKLGVSSGRRCLERHFPTTLPGLDIEIAVLACEDFMLNKLLAGRPDQSGRCRRPCSAESRYG